MSIDIEGWIEVKNIKTQRWDGVQNISSYLIFAGDESDQLFGITKIPRAEPIAANRGLPDDLSQEAKDTIAGYREFEKEESNFSFEELFGFSYISYKEILKHDLVNRFDHEIGWSKVFSRLKSIQEDAVSTEDIRVVVWANW